MVEDRTGITDKLSDIDQLKLSRNIIREYTKDINGLLQLKTQSEDGTMPPVNFSVESQMELEILQREVKLLEQVNKKINARIEAERQLKLEKKDDKVIKEFTPEQKFIEFLTPLQKLAKDAEDPLKEINAQLALIDEILQSENKTELLKFYGLTEEQIGAVVDALGLLKKEMGQTGEVTDAMAETLERAADQFANDFINALQNGENALVSFRNLVGDMIQQVIAEFLKMQVIKPMMNALFTAVGLPTMPTGKAGGGTIQGGRATLVGERGPEIFVPNTGGTIMNNMNSKNAMGGGGTTVINQSINFATGIVPTVRAEVTKMMPQIADVTKAAVQEASMRGGSYRRSLLGG